MELPRLPRNSPSSAHEFGVDHKVVTHESTSIQSGYYERNNWDYHPYLWGKLGIKLLIFTGKSDHTG